MAELLAALPSVNKASASGQDGISYVDLSLLAVETKLRASFSEHTTAAGKRAALSWTGSAVALFRY